MTSRSFVFALSAALTGVPALASDPFSIEAASHQEKYLLGEPILLTVVVTNTSDSAVSVTFTRPPLAVEISKAGGAIWEECGLCTARWGLVRKVLPVGWRHEETLTVYLEAPGKYALRSRLKKHWNIEHLPAEYSDVWWEDINSDAVYVWVDEPEGIDGEAFAAFQGRPLQQSAAKSDGSQLLAGFPSSRYAGYVLARQISPLPGVGKDPADKVRQLTRSDFFSRFPTTRDRRDGSTEGSRLDMSQEVRRAAQLRRDFIDLHPDFPLRTKLEKLLGDLELVLGNYERAYVAWKWVADHTTDNVEWARGMVQAMESQGLVAAQSEAQPGSADEGPHTSDSEIPDRQQVSAHQERRAQQTWLWGKHRDRRSIRHVLMSRHRPQPA